MSKRTQRRAEQRRANRLNREQNVAFMLAQQAPTPETMLAQQAPTGRPETMLAQQAPTGRPETMLAQQAPTGRPETMLAQQAPTGRPETMLAQQAPTGRPETMLAQQAPTGRPETMLAQQAPTGRPETMLAQQAPTGRPETMLAQQAPTGRPETMLAQQAPTGRPETMLAQQAPTGRPETIPTTSEAQIANDHENASHSTGPTSNAGKAIVSQNRTVHGLNYNPNTFRVLACEDQSAYDDLLRQLTAEHKPTETTETLLVTSMAQHRWLLERANRIQENCFDQQTAEITDQKLFALYLRYATTHERAFHKCLTDLLKLRSTKQKIEFGFESQKHRADRHQHFLDLKDLDFTYRQMKILDVEHSRLLAEHPEIWPPKGKKAA